ncbi:ABC transporter permease [Wukongibacter baidiensis]|uniref:ABC transporter permease n=1 Tax=Wukongibacter baidiensis TaxID=1723361 RepID=UPI003D7F589D
MKKKISTWKMFINSRLGRIGFAIMIIFILMALFAPIIAPFNPYERVAESFLKPSSVHLLGTNDIGQDIFSEIIYGTRISLLIGLLSAIVAIIIGSTIGIVSGYFGGKVDILLMRVVDLTLVLPMLPLMILLAAFLGPSFWNIIMVIGVLSWARPARVIRAQVLTTKTKGYIESVKVAGGGHVYTMIKHILPPTMSIIISQFILVASHSILVEASLSFLGMGDPTKKSWGIILYYAQARGAFLNEAWIWWILPPGLLITFLVISFAYTGNSLEEIVNPRLRRS